MASTPPTMTRPGSPAACASTASTTGPSRSRPGIARAGSTGSPVSMELPSSLRVGELAVDIAPRVTLRDVASPVVALLAAGQAELDLGAASGRDVQPQRHDRLALGLRPPEQLVDLGAVEQQLANALGLVVVAVTLLER